MHNTISMLSWLTVFGACYLSILQPSKYDSGNDFVSALESKKTTSGRIFVHNLTSNASTFGNTDLNRNWESALQSKYQLVQIKNSHELARECVQDVEDLVRFAPSAQLYKLRSQLCLFLHQFEKAEQSLKKVKELRGIEYSTIELELAFVKGNVDQSLGRLRKKVKANPTIHGLSNLGAIENRLGNQAVALDIFERALRIYGDPDPFPLAWLLVQIGAIHEDCGRTELAAKCFAEAKTRLPAYALAQEKISARTNRSGQKSSPQHAQKPDRKSR